MVSSKRQLALAAIVTAAQAFESLSVPAAITAGETFTLTITTNDTDSAYDSYRVYLDTTPPGYTGGPSCKIVCPHILLICSPSLRRSRS